ncbi:M24 family metallopeptidase [Halobellus ruber]|uniref:Aminopeptidase P family protein n=1 Tax=Halobellus ruber TaxID=2761102 RepID=A0A7J9SE20_9EURY|nr:Xaa-Pro peptidase family protein [Halobellus ruber]MBB6644988.1 aminopeptidase P family protein [Halobellus ruber]
MGEMSVEDRLDRILTTEELNAFVQYKEGSDTNHKYLTGFQASDPFTYLRYENRSILLVAPVEKAKAENQSTADEVRSTAEFVSGDVRDDIEAEASIIADFVGEYEIERIGVPRDFDLYLAERLEDEGFSVRTVDDVVMEARKRKSESELAHLRDAQRATERSMERAQEIIRESSVVDGELFYGDERLTSERLRNHIREFLMDRQCALDEAIVACGTRSADPHDRGSGILRPDEPILLDIFPQHESGYWGDMSRTFVKGTPPEEFQEMYETTREAMDAALNVLSEGAGVTGQSVHDTVCDVFESAGYPTIRDGDVDRGLLHSTGHAIGLDLHEPPRLVQGAGELEEGYVLTVEPGLYDDDYGGVRIEDMIVVTEDGYENFNQFAYDYQV